MHVSEPHRSFIAAEAITKGQLVTSNSNAEAAVASTVSIGTAERTVASGDIVSVYLHGPTREVIASAALTIGERVTHAAAGKVAADVAGEWIALNASSADGNVIEVARIL